MRKRVLPLSRVYGLLEPGPVVLLSTAWKGDTDIMTQSWHTMLEFEPPLIACVVSNRNHSFRLLRGSRECVINIPSVALAEQVVGCGNTSGSEVDKFAAFGLTPRPSSCIGAPRIAECFANLECRVADTRMVPRYGLFVLEVVKAWIARGQVERRMLHHQGRGVFAVDGELIRLPSRMK